MCRNLEGLRCRFWVSCRKSRSEAGKFFKGSPITARYFQVGHYLAGTLA